jgi:hypothetical protein
MLPRTALACLCAVPLVATGEAIGATLTNLDAEPFLLTVTEGGGRTELTVRTGQTLEFCFEGCFVALPNGDRAALTGTEIVEISGGRIKAK